MSRAVVGISSVFLSFFGAMLALCAQDSPAKNVQVFTQKELGFQDGRLAAISAVWTTLDSSPQIQLQGTDVEQRKGGIMVAEGEFDTNVIANGSATLSQTGTDLSGRGDTLPSATPIPNSATRNESVYQWEAGIRKKLRNGIVVQPTVGYQRNTFSENGDFQNRGQFGFNFGVIIPLAKGFGNLSNEAPQIAATYDYNASLFSLRQVTAQSVYDTMAAYWECRAAEERYQLVRQTEDISARLVGQTDALVKAGQLGSSQLSQILADENSTIAQRIASEQALIFARQQLAVAIGYNPSILSQAPLVKDRFPEPVKKMEFPDMRELTTAALALRDDLRASKLLVKSRKVLVAASVLNLRPTVNLQLNSGYSPFQEITDTLAQTGGGWTGSAGVNIEWPVENHTARGVLIQDTATYLRSQINVEDLTRTIVSNIITTLAQLRGTAAQVLLLKEAAAQNGQALAAQEELFSHGQSNLTDVITARQRMIQSQLEYVDAQQNYATTIIRLRLESGTLLPWNEKSNWVSPDLWTTLPFVNSGGKPN